MAANPSLLPPTSHWFQRFIPRIRRYRQYRAEQIALHSAIKEERHESDITGAGAYMDLIQGGTFVFDDKSETDMFSDFTLYEWPDNGGMNCIDRFRKNNESISGVRKIILSAMSVAYTSLFRVESVHPRRALVCFYDLFRKRRIDATDINMSLYAKAGDLVFGRILIFPGLSIFTGAAFAFPAEEAGDLMEIATKIFNRDCSESEQSRRLFRKFFQRHRTRGIDVIYR